MPEPGAPDMLGLDDRTDKAKDPSIADQKRRWNVFRRESRKSRPKIDAEHHHGPLPWGLVTIGIVALLFVIAIPTALSVYWAGHQRDRENAALVKRIDGAVAQIDPKLAVVAKQLEKRLASWSIGQETKINAQLDEVNGKVGGLDARITGLAKRIPSQEQVLQWTMAERRAWLDDQRRDPDSTLNTIAGEQAARIFSQQHERLARELAPQVAEYLGPITLQQVRNEYREMLKKTRLQYEQERSDAREQSGVLFTPKKQ